MWLSIENTTKYKIFLRITGLMKLFFHLLCCHYILSFLRLRIRCYSIIIENNDKKSYQKEKYQNDLLSKYAKSCGKSSSGGKQ